MIIDKNKDGIGKEIMTPHLCDMTCQLNLAKTEERYIISED